MEISKIQIKSECNFTGVVYIGQYGTSGYATAAKGNLYYFFRNNIPICWIPIHFDKSQLSDDCVYNTMIKSLIRKPINDCDTIIIHSTPDTWKDITKQNQPLIGNKKVIGYTVWETNKLPPSWVNHINENVHEVWCPSKYNATVFKNSGVTIPIKIFPHVFLPKELPKKELVSIKSSDGMVDESDRYTFYNISELNIRKGVEDLVNVFCQSFTEEDNVRLILKIHYKDYNDKNTNHCLSILNKIVSEYKNPPKIHYIVDNLSDKEILGIHSIGDCYVSLCKSEGFGLTIFEAFKYNKKVITTGFGGQVDFLGDNYDGLVKYKVGPVTGMDVFSKNYTSDQEWAYPDLDHASELMRKMVNK
jgi:glycosyltransferase involved in cell wall biosynthesis